MKIGILTSGGDTPGMNAVIRAVSIKCKNQGYELIGFKNGWSGLMENQIVEIPPDLIDMIDLGGTILGSSRQNPYAKENGVDKIKTTFEILNLDCCIAIGGEDTLGVAYKLFKDGLNMIGVPKTIDNDLDATDYTFGFNSAVTIATDALDKLKTTAKSHERVIVVEIMGRHAGWITLHSGIAGGAHLILLPEFPLTREQICSVIKKRYDDGFPWAIVAVSEGYGFVDESLSEKEKDEFGHVRLEKEEIGKQIATLLKEKLKVETRAIILGHLQRGGSPTAFDRVLCSQLGLKAVEYAKNRYFGTMPSLNGTRINKVSLEDAVANLKVVDEENWQYAKELINLK